MKPGARGRSGYGGRGGPGGRRRHDNMEEVISNYHNLVGANNMLPLLKLVQILVVLVCVDVYDEIT